MGGQNPRLHVAELIEFDVERVDEAPLILRRLRERQRRNASLDVEENVLVVGAVSVFVVFFVEFFRNLGRFRIQDAFRILDDLRGVGRFGEAFPIFPWGGSRAEVVVEHCRDFGGAGVNRLEFRFRSLDGRREFYEKKRRDDRQSGKSTESGIFHSRPPFDAFHAPV